MAKKARRVEGARSAEGANKAGGVPAVGSRDADSTISPGPPPGFSILVRARRSRPALISSEADASVLGLRVGDREARADRQRGELIDCIPARAPVRQLLLVDLLRHVRLPF